MALRATQGKLLAVIGDEVKLQAMSLNNQSEHLCQSHTKRAGSDHIPPLESKPDYTASYLFEMCL